MIKLRSELLLEYIVNVVDSMSSIISLSYHYNLNTSNAGNENMLMISLKTFISSSCVQ